MERVLSLYSPLVPRGITAVYYGGLSPLQKPNRTKPEQKNKHGDAYVYFFCELELSTSYYTISILIYHPCKIIENYMFVDKKT